MSRARAAWRHVVAAACFAAVAAGCAGPKRPSTPVPPIDFPAEPAVRAEDRPEVQEIYDSITDGLGDYSRGLQLVVDGEEVAGEDEIAWAAARLRAEAELCVRTTGCDVTHVFDAFERLLSDQDIALKHQASRVTDLEAQVEAMGAGAEQVDREPGTSAFSVPMAENGRADSLFRGTDVREVITLNGPVRAAIDDWLTWMRPILMNSWVHYRFLQAETAPIFTEAGLPEALLFAMIATETGGKVHAYSRAGAAGPLQFMRRTGRTYGLRVVDGFDLRLDPASATRAAVRYLEDRFEELGGNLEKALAAYNGGESRIKRLQRQHRGAGFWDARFYYVLPRETREYVPRVLAAAWLFLHPEEYNLEFPDLDASVTDLPLKREIALGELTICLGQDGSPDGWFRTLRNLNPRLSPAERVPAGHTLRIPSSLVATYEARCLAGEYLERAQELHQANYPPEPPTTVYTVQRNDTLGKIASRFGCVSLHELAELNAVRPPRFVIRVGQELKIPKCE